MRIRLAAIVGFLLASSCSTRATCPADDVECMGAAFRISDFDDWFEDSDNHETLTLVSAEELAAVAPDMAASLFVESATDLVFTAADEGQAMVTLWSDLNGCRPAFCFSHCPRGVRCFSGARCTPPRNDGITREATTHWVEYTKTPERSSDMDVTVVPVSAPDCPADIDTLLATGVAGPPYILQVHVPADGDSGNGGPCGDGIQASTLNCTPIGSGGVNDTCISREEYESTTGLPLPASCYPEGTEGCFEPQQGYLVRPCCPGYTCALGSMCGGGSVLGGVCIPN